MSMPVYNPYYPTNYQAYQTAAPYYQQFQPQTVIPQTPQMQPTVQTAPIQQATQPAQQQNPSNIIWVGADKEVYDSYLPPNSAAAFWNQNEPVVYLKKTDATGKPNTRIFDLVERVEQSQNEASGSTVDVSHFAEKSDLAAIAGIVGSMQKDIEAIKEEMGNLASQAVKRAVGAKPKKETVQEDDD